MNSNKFAKVLTRIFGGLFSVCFIFLFINIIVIGFDGKVDRRFDSFSKMFILLIFAVLTVGICAFYFYYTADKSNKRCKRIKTKAKFELTDINTKRIIFIGCGILLIAEFIFAMLTDFEPVADLHNIRRYAMYFSSHGNFDLIEQDYARNYQYLIRYPNNMALLLIVSLVGRLSYLISGHFVEFAPVVVNIFAINISVILTAFTAKRLFGNRKAVFVLAFCALFLPYLTYLPYYYSDSMSMPFLIGAVYLMVSAFQGDNRKSMYAKLCAAGALVFLGYKVKGSIIILFAVGVVLLFLKFRLKRAICLILVFTAGFGAIGFAYNTAVDAVNPITKQQYEEYEYPVTHWIMMGLKGLGKYDEHDDYYTRSFHSKQEKQDANIKVIKERVKKYKIDGLYDHMVKKAVWTWQDGTYYISYHNQKPKNDNILMDFLHINGKYNKAFQNYSSALQMFILLMICISALKTLVRPEVDEMLLLKGIVFSAFLFFLLWETRSRYLFNMTPLFILLMVDGMDTAKAFLDSLKKPGKHTAERTTV